MAFPRVYKSIRQMTRATVTLEAREVSYGELAFVDGRPAQVIKLEGTSVTVQVFSGTQGISTDAGVQFTGQAPKLNVSELLAGRYFNALGEPIDGLPQPKGTARFIQGPAVNPVRRAKPSQLMATGIGGIDLNNSLVTGQKIPFFADPDQPYNAVLSEVALRTEVDIIVLGGIGISRDDLIMFRKNFEKSGAEDRIVSFINTSEDSPMERLLIPHMSLTAAEYFANDLKKNVLVLLTDMTLYADALAIVSNKMDQIPSKDAMPGSLYSDLANIYEKAVQFPHGGSITLIAVTTLNDGDITHAIPDNTGYITEGQLYLKKDVYTGKTIIDPFRSLSRLKQNVIGKQTRHDHPQLMNAMVRLYADAEEARVKRDNGFEINDYDKRSMEFALEYSDKILSVDVNLSMNEVLDLGWSLVQKYFEAFELGIKQDLLDEFWKKS
jgi:V/A-type H+-transporting ATPase subunit B